MNDKDNDLDIILNQYSGKKSEGKSGISDDTLDSLLDLSFTKNKNSLNKASSDENEDTDKNSELEQEILSYDVDEDISENAPENDNEAEDISAAEDETDENTDEDLSLSESDTDEETEDEEDMSSVSEDALAEGMSVTDSSITVTPSKSGGKSDKKPKKKKKRKKAKVNSSIFVALIVVCIVLTISFAISIYGINLGMEYLGVGKKDVEITINIPSGSNSADITKILYDNGIIENEKLFKLILKLKGSGGDLKPGDITLKPIMGYDEIIRALCETRESYEQVEITFPEGISLLAVAELLQENNVCSSEEFIYEFNSENMGYDYEESVTTSAEKYYKFEGFFFPDTYMFYVDDSAYNVTKNMRAQFEKKLVDNDIYNKVKKSGFSMEEVITLASIVQAEAATPEDMKLVASVFINRLNSPDEFPKLQSDATDNYYKNVIVPNNGDSTSLSMFEQAYNTYVRDALPAGPIGNPGMDAILAVLDAPKTEYYYFCSNIETKECFFAETLSEHEKNLEKAGLV